VKKVILLLIVLIGLFIGALFAAPHFISNKFIEDAIKKQAGLDVKIKGDISISLFPKVVFEAGGLDIRAYNGRKSLLSSGPVAIDIDLGRLLSGQLHVNKFSWTKPEVYLEVSESGVANWLPKRKSRNSKGTNLSFLQGLDNVEIKHLGITYNNLVSGQKHEITRGGLSISNKTGKKTDLVAAFQMAGVPIRLLGDFDIANPAGVPLNMRLIVNKENDVFVKGRVLGAFDQPSFGGDISMEGETFVASLKEMLQMTDLEIAEVPFKLSSIVRYEETSASLSEFKIDLGKMSLGGIINYGLKDDRKTLEVRLEGSMLNLDSLGVCGVKEEQTRNARNNKKHEWSDELIDLTGLQSIDSSLHLSWNKVVCDSYTFEPAVVRIRVNHEGILIDEIKLSQKAGGYITAKGKVEDGEENIDGQLQIRWNDLALEEVVGESAARFIEIPLSGTNDVTFAGKSIKQWVESLDGKLRFTTKKGSIKGVDLNNLLGATMDMIMGTKPSQGHNYQIKAMTGEFDIADGVIESKKFEIDVADILIKGSGKISLPDWSVSYALDAKNRGQLVPTVRIKGPLSDPKITADVAKKAIGAGIGAAMGGPVGAAIGAAVGDALDGKGGAAAEKKEPVLPFDLKDKKNLEDNVRKFLRDGFEKLEEKKTE
jgi:uncharacterized protein involved in outer membrane biogenesis